MFSLVHLCSGWFALAWFVLADLNTQIILRYAPKQTQQSVFFILPVAVTHCFLSCCPNIEDATKLTASPCTFTFTWVKPVILLLKMNYTVISTLLLLKFSLSSYSVGLQFELYPNLSSSGDKKQEQHEVLPALFSLSTNWAVLPAHNLQQ